MTEEEWLACLEPWPMLVYLERQASERKLRLVAVAFCYRIWHLLTDDRSRQAVLVGERFADGMAERKELLAVDAEAEAARGVGAQVYLFAATAAWSISSDTCYYFRNEGGPRIDNYHSGPSPEYVSGQAIDAAVYFRAEANNYATMDEDQDTEKAAHVTMIRDVFGNPFQPVAFNPVWWASDVMLLANGIYADRAFDRLPILADALQEAGCDSADLLNHLRDPNATHVRGCWALDLVLGKE